MIQENLIYDKEGNIISVDIPDNLEKIEITIDGND